VRLIATIAVCCTCLGPSATAFAQAPAGAFASVRLISDRDASWNVSVPSGAGGGIAGGIDFSRRFGIEIAGDWPLARTTTSIRTAVDPVFGLQRSTRRVTYQSPSLSGALRIHVLSSRRIRVTALAGLGFVSHRSTYDSLVERLDGKGQVLSQVEPIIRGRYLWAGPIVGLETAVMLGQHVAIVPEIRAIWFPIADTGSSTSIIRPAVGLRWTF